MNKPSLTISPKEKAMMLFFALITSVSFLTTFRSCQVTVNTKPTSCDSSSLDNSLEPIFDSIPKP